MRIAIPEKAIAAIISTISEEAPIRKYLYEYTYYMFMKIGEAASLITSKKCALNQLGHFCLLFSIATCWHYLSDCKALTIAGSSLFAIIKYPLVSNKYLEINDLNLNNINFLREA